MNDSVVALVRILGDIADAYGDASEAGGRAHRALALAEGIQEFRGQQIERLIMTCREMGPVLSPADRDKLKAAAMRVLADSRGFHAALGKGLRGRMGPGSWAALGRACAMALARTVLDPTVGGKALVSQIQWAVANRNYAMAQAMLQQLRRRDAELYERLMAEMGEGPGETDGG